ncbi:MAG: phage tail protein [Endozoicomonadaceae bacterium]|nr:phage tail protein [Endozoicomonadaceae bacterium]
MSAEPFIGEIIMFGGSFAPRDWAFCDGQLLPIAQNTALFSILGTTYGGDGRTTFALPDLRGRVPMHVGEGPGLTPKNWGQKGGRETVTLDKSQLPSDSSDLQIYNDVGDQTQVDDKTKSLAITGTDNGRSKSYVGKSFSTNTATIKIPNAIAGGGGQPVNTVQPYTAIHFIICLQGIFPSRN